MSRNSVSGRWAFSTHLLRATRPVPTIPSRPQNSMMGLQQPHPPRPSSRPIFFPQVSSIPIAVTCLFPHSMHPLDPLVICSPCWLSQCFRLLLPVLLTVGVVFSVAVSALKRAASFIAASDESPTSSISAENCDFEMSHKGVDKVVVLGDRDDGVDEGEPRSIIGRAILPLARSISRRFSLPFGRLNAQPHLVDNSASHRTWISLFIASL